MLEKLVRNSIGITLGNLLLEIIFKKMLKKHHFESIVVNVGGNHTSILNLLKRLPASSYRVVADFT